MFTTGIKQLAYSLLDTAACHESAVLSSSLLFGHSFCFTFSCTLTLHFSNFSCLKLFPSPVTSCCATWLYDVTLSMEFPWITRTIGGFPPSLDLLSSLSINLNTPLPVVPSIPECPMSVVLFTSDSTVLQEQQCNASSHYQNSINMS